MIPLPGSVAGNYLQADPTERVHTEFNVGTD